jgi:hypothetical protein
MYYQPMSTPDPDPHEWLTADQVAALTHMSPRWVRVHAADLGGFKAGDAGNSPLRFTRARIAAYVASREADPES